MNSTLLLNAIVENAARLIVCGDLHCPGIDGRISEKLDDVLFSYGLRQLVEQSTRSRNLLDMFDPANINHIRVDSQHHRHDPAVTSSDATTSSSRPVSVTWCTSRILPAMQMGSLLSYSP